MNPHDRRPDAERYIRFAMAEAELAARTGNRPFGAVVVDPKGTVVSRDHNRVVEAMDPSAHAEINAIRAACRRGRTLTLPGFRLYTNAEPCPMCVACMVKAGISAVYYAAPAEPEASPAIPIDELVRRTPGHRVSVHGGILAEEALRRMARLAAHGDVSGEQEATP